MEIVFLVALIVLLIFGITAFTGAPYVPSHQKDIDKVFKEFCPLKKTDLLVDIGMGDGRVVLAAARQGARALGIEINPFLVLIGKWRLRKYPRAQTKWGNFKSFQFSAETTVVYTFGDGRDIAKMYQIVKKQAQRLGHPIRLISYAFQVPGHKPTKKQRLYYLYDIKADS